MYKYETIIYWSDEDTVYVADVSELPGCSAHGDTVELALANIKEAMQLWTDTANEFGDPVPEPNLCQSLKRRRLMYDVCPTSEAAMPLQSSEGHHVRNDIARDA